MKDGYVLHTISRVDDEGWHSFRRVDAKRGVAIDYLAKEPLQVQVPIEAEAQAECLANYSTNIGGEKVMGAVGAVARFSLHDLESLFGGMKSALSDGEALDDPETIRAQVIAWVPWSGNGRGRGKPTYSRSAVEEMSEEEKLELIAKYFTLTD